MFKEPRTESKFCWADLGDIQEGRPNLGDFTTVTMYRLMQYTLRDELIKRYGPETASEILYEAGKNAGREFCRNLVDTCLEFNEFAAQLQKALKDHRVGIFRIENAIMKTMEMIITLSEDLDCSGLPMSDELVCNYDEGFFAGIMELYTGKPFNVREVDCWAMGGRVCRFQAKQDNAA